MTPNCGSTSWRAQRRPFNLAPIHTTSGRCSLIAPLGSLPCYGTRAGWMSTPSASSPSSVATQPYSSRNKFNSSSPASVIHYAQTSCSNSQPPSTMWSSLPSPMSNVTCLVNRCCRSQTIALPTASTIAATPVASAAFVNKPASSSIRLSPFEVAQHHKDVKCFKCDELFTSGHHQQCK
jgi:hypothetical protein